MIAGTWPYQHTERGKLTVELPDRVELGGRSYLRARLESPNSGPFAWMQDPADWERDVIEQYREDVPRWSRHLKVFRDGTYEITHSDDYNPDRSSPWWHFWNDMTLGRILGAAAGAFVLILFAAALVALYRAARPTR